MPITSTVECRNRIETLRKNLGRVIEGKDEVIETLCIALVAGGSILMEDVPGVGKTTLAKALARSIDASFNRIQFTPDLLPGDILGSSIYNPVTGVFSFREGPIFCNVLLADEINRASPRTQSALLEAMNELQVSIEGKRHPLPSPFFVIATQNPIEFHGTYPLPEAQLDRFLVLLTLGYPDAATETSILYSQSVTHPLQSLQPVLTREEVGEMQLTVRQIRVEESVARYIVELCRKTREDPRLSLGVSPRGTLMLFTASRAAALADGRDHVEPDDARKMAVPVLAHRVLLTPKARYAGVRKEAVIREVLETVRIPV